MFPAFQERVRQLFRRARFDGGVVSKSTPVVETVQTWNNASEVFVAEKVSIIDTSSASASLLKDWQVNGVTVLAARKSGQLFARASTTTPAYSFSAQPSAGIGGVGNNGVGVYSAAIARLFFWEDGRILVASTSSIIWTTGAPADAATVALAPSAGMVSVTSGTAGVFRDIKLRNLIGTGNLATGTVSKSADYTTTTDDGTIEVDASGAARTITLFAASGNAGKILVIKKTDSSANAVTVDANASETIDGATTVSLASQYSTITIQVNAAGTAWHKISGV